MTKLCGRPGPTEMAIRALRDARCPLYVGAINNRNNFGDDLLFRAHEHLLGVRLGHLPMGGNNRLLRLRVRRSRYLPVLLGGGTLIGRPAYRRAIEAARSSKGSAVSLSVLGVGVSPAGSQGKSTSAELADWVPVLRQFPVVRVRGPRSQAHLAQLGIDSVVVGDPVLALLSPLRSARPPAREHLRVGVNVAAVEGWDTAASAVLELLTSLRQEDGSVEVRVIAAADYDEPAALRFSNELRVRGISSSPINLTGATPHATAGVLGELDLIVAVRLHVMVAAAALDIPYVGLCYEGKCWDFQESIGLEPSSADLAGLDIQRLSSMVQHVRVHGLARSVRTRVDELAASLIAASEEVLAELGIDAKR